ncbi:MAG: rhomboid family intramembrane serine protease [Prevotellaceae bacterium]|jgi:membrane associated rhomboid family serine protease|nr:rhomboid family intramembrane serine protease [Prevotellaceae bacterium]
MNPFTVLTFITAGVSILAFWNRRLLNNLLLYPYIMVRKNQWYRIISHAFIHADWMHLLFNMIALWSFGEFVFHVLAGMTASPVLHAMTLYFTAILFSSLPDIVKKRNSPDYASLGASGAVSAVVFFAILADPWMMLYVFFIPCPGILFGIVYLLYSNYMSKRGGDIINHSAHLYGAVWGLLYPIFVHPGIYMDFIYKLLHPSLW